MIKRLGSKSIRMQRQISKFLCSFCLCRDDLFIAGVGLIAPLNRHLGGRYVNPLNERMLALVLVPPKIEEDGQSLSKVIVGDEVELPCNVTGIPRPRIIWQKGTRILSGGMPGGCSMLEWLGSAEMPGASCTAKRWWVSYPFITGFSNYQI